MIFLSHIALASAALQLNFTLQNKPSTLTLDQTGLYARDAVSANTSLTSSYNFYFTKLLLGTPAQELDVIIDTGSPVSWVFGPNVSFEQALNFTAPKFYPGNSSSFEWMNDTFSAAYGAGSYTGTWGNDSAAIPEYENKTVTNFPVGVIEQYQAGNSAPGLLALGPHIGYAGPTTYKNFPEALYEQGLIDSAGFSIDLVDDAGSILFGGVDLGAIEFPIYWYNYSDTSSRSYSGFYTVPLTSLTINENSSTTHMVKYPAVIDSGSPMSLVPTAFVEQIAAQWNLANVSSYRAYYLDDGRKPEDLEGWVTFQIGYFSVDIAISDLFAPGEYIWGSNGPQGVQALSLIGSMNNILGDAFCRHAYITFDSAQERVYLSRRKSENTTLPYIISPNNLTGLAVPGKLAVTESSISFVTSATASGVLYGPNQYIGQAANASITEAATSGAAEASATATGSAASASGGQSASGSESSSSSSSSSANAAFLVCPSFIIAAFAFML